MRKSILFWFREIKQRISDLTLKLTISSQWVNLEYALDFFKEVKYDIKTLKEGFNDCRYERERNADFQHIAEKYAKKYCPSYFFQYFSDANQFEYGMLRASIDELLDRKNQEFSDFLD